MRVLLLCLVLSTISGNGSYGIGYERNKIEVVGKYSRHYLAGCYERDVPVSGASIDRLYLGCTAYSAPVVLTRTKSTDAWTIQYLHRDHLGSITAITNGTGAKIAEYSFDPWGRQRDPATLVAYLPDNAPALLTGRGFTGHEHLPQFGLINMNARLYDPVLGRFLSPDPYVQAPDWSQSFNRYTYCGNNPLMYVDENGEMWWVASIIGFVSNYAIHGISTGDFGWKAVEAGFKGALLSTAGYGIGLAANAGATALGASNFVAGMASGVFAGAGSGALGAMITPGANFGTSVFTGALGGAIGGAVNLGNMNLGTLKEGLVSTFMGAWTGGLIATVTGGDPLLGMRNGAVGAAAGFATGAVTKYIRQQNQAQKFAEELLQIDADYKSYLEGYGSGIIRTSENIYDPKQVLWNKLGSLSKKYGLAVDWFKTRDYDETAILKFGKMHIRYGSGKMMQGKHQATPYLLNTKSINVHYDLYDVVVNPLKHIYHDTYKQGRKGAH